METTIGPEREEVRHVKDVSHRQGGRVGDHALHPHKHSAAPPLHVRGVKLPVRRERERQLEVLRQHLSYTKSGGYGGGGGGLCSSSIGEWSWRVGGGERKRREGRIHVVVIAMTVKRAGYILLRPCHESRSTNASTHAAISACNATRNRTARGKLRIGKESRCFCVVVFRLPSLLVWCRFVHSCGCS